MIEIIDTIVEFALLIGSTYFVVSKQDIRLIVFSCALYVASVIRHGRKEN